MKTAALVFEATFREKFEGDPSKSRIYKDISKGVIPAGIEYYLPLFFESTATLFDYLPQTALLCLHHDIHPAVENFWRDTQSRYQLLRGDSDRPLLKPSDLFLTTEAFFGALKPYPRIEIHSSTQSQSKSTILRILPNPCRHSRSTVALIIRQRNLPHSSSNSPQSSNRPAAGHCC